MLCNLKAEMARRSVKCIDLANLLGVRPATISANLVVYLYSILDIVSELREDLTIIYTAHSETERTEDGYMWTRMKTTGKKLNKLVPESKFNVVLLAKCKEGRYIFETHSRNSTTKTPLDAFEEDEIENDIVPMLKVLEEY